MCSFWIKREDYVRENKETAGKTYMKKIKMPTQMKTTYDYYCPVLCQQKKNGSYGKKTFNGKKCCECGFEKKTQGTEYRSEQVFAYDTVRSYFTHSNVKMEYEVHDLSKYCQLDIAVLPEKIAIRLNGGVHEKRKQKIKDEDQKLMLEEDGWKVVDFWYYDMPYLFDTNRTEKKDLEATFEVLKRIKPYLNNGKV